MSEIALALAQELVSSAPVVSEEGKQVLVSTSSFTANLIPVIVTIFASILATYFYFSLVNPMTWYKEEFPGVMAFTGNVMKDMGYTAMNNLLSKRKIWKSPVTPFNRLSLSGRDDEDYYDDYYYDDEVDRDDKDVSARSRAEVSGVRYLRKLFDWIEEAYASDSPTEESESSAKSL